MDENSFIPQIEPWIDGSELEELKEVIDSTFVTEHKKTKEFEDMFKELTGAKHAVAYANGTVGLFAALKVLGIGKRDEVIVPDLTFIATANAVILAGATPILVDIDPETLQLDTNLIEQKITENTKAIMPVHLYGGAVKMDEVIKLAKKYDLKIVEDAAQGVGVKLNGKHVGTFGDIGMISFYGNKTMTTAEGGIMLTDSDELAKELYAFKNHGRYQKGIFTHENIGYNFSFNDLVAAVGVAQMKKLPRIIERKREIMDLYKKLLPEVEFYEYPSEVEPVPWFTSIKIEDPEDFGQFMKQNQMGTRRFFYPLHMQPCYSDKEFIKGEFQCSKDAYDHGISLPSSVQLTDEQITKIAKTVNDYFETKARLHRDIKLGDSSTATCSTKA